ncbi:MAG TPA: hypothetical protein VN611_10890 [Patescibacteria group bacterium]|nr:hypothetical protein [Patescibacteria group bacterium]
MMTMASEAANVLGMSEEVVQKFLFLVDALEQETSLTARRSKKTEAWMEHTERLEALVQEYDLKI